MSTKKKKKNTKVDYPSLAMMKVLQSSRQKSMKKKVMIMITMKKNMVWQFT